VRRRVREQEAAAMNELLATNSDDQWNHIAPQLDAALGKLSEPECEAVLLRYFEGKSALEMARILGISDEAAQKRTSRAVERLREFFVRRGVTVGASALALLLSTNAVQSAPVGLAATTCSAVLAGTAAKTSTVITATKILIMTTIQKVIIAKLAGRVTLLAIHRVAEAERRTVQVKDVMSPDWPTAYPDEDLFTILKRFAAKDAGNLPVVTRQEPDRPIGLITRSGLWAALETAKKERVGRLARLKTEDRPGAPSLSG